MYKFNTKDYAIYLPAINDFASGITKEMSNIRPFPEEITINDLNFWDKSNKLFHYPFILNSAGRYAVGDWPNNAVTRADKGEVMIIGDSGGYQLGTGKLKGLPGFNEKMSAQEVLERWDAVADRVRKWVVAFSESFTTHAMTLDHPLWLLTDPDSESAFANCTMEQLTALTVENLHYIDAHRQGFTKWINVVQGLTTAEIDYWWDAVKPFKFSGWALAGGAGARGGLYQTLYTILRMRDEGAFEDGCNHLHVLGVSKLNWAIFLTAIQNTLRTQYPEMTVTFDSSSPFQTAMIYNKAYITPNLGKNPSSWSLSSNLVPQGHSYRESTDKFPQSTSPLGKKMVLGDLNVQGGVHAKKHFDSLSLYMIAHHNVWVMLDAIQQANQNAFGEDKETRTPLPYLKCIEVIQKALKAKEWRQYLEANKDLLDSVTPNAYAPKTKEAVTSN